MSRLSTSLVVVVALLIGILAMVTLFPQSPVDNSKFDDTAVRTIVAQMLAEQKLEIAPQALELPPVEVATIDQETINPLIENFLMGDPKILQRVSEALQAQLRIEEIDQARLSLALYQDDLYDDQDHVVLGNPEGDVTLVEFFDYNCGFCRRAMPDTAKLLEEDPNLRIILKEFPVLSNDSVQAARVAVVVAAQVGDAYKEFHEILFTSTSGQINRESALDAAEQLGLDRENLIMLASGDDVTQAIQRTYALAEALGITGTPTYVLGDEILPGAVGYEALKSRIDNLRECGSTVCDG